MTGAVQNSPGGERLIFYNDQGKVAADPYSLARPRAELNRAAIFDFLLYGTILPPNSIFSEVKSLFPGQKVEQRNGVLHLDNPVYKKYAEIEERNSMSLEEFANQLDQIFQKVITQSIQNNERIALMLSGGIDSAIIASYLPKTAVAITWAGWGEGSTDLRYAQMTAKSLGLADHLVCYPDDIQDRKLYRQALSELGYPFVFTAGAPYLRMAKKLDEHFHHQNYLAFQGQNADTITGAFRPTVLSYYFAKWHVFLRFVPFKRLLTRYRRKFFLTTSENPIELIAFFHSNGIYPGPWICIPKSYFDKKLQQIEEQLGHPMRNFQDQILMEELMTEARRNQYVQNYLPQMYGAGMKLPYYEREVIELFLRVPQKIRRQDNFGKVVLRRLAELRGIPQEVIEKGKKGLSYGQTDFFKKRLHLAVWDEIEQNEILNACINVKLLRSIKQNNPATFDVLSSLHYYLNTLSNLSIK